MNTKQLILHASLALASVFACRPTFPAMTGADLAAADAAVRAADAAWAAVAKTANIDAWMAFYAADAIVMPPNVQLTSDRELVRQSVGHLLSSSRLSIAWHPITVEVAATGDLASLIGAYELRSTDSRGTPASDRGKLLEIWKKQSDGSWKCIVNTWLSDGPAADPAAGAPTANTVASAPKSAQAPASEYGDMPAQYEDAVRQYFQTYLKDPGSVQYQEITKPEKGYATAITGGLLSREKRLLGWKVKATINAKNSHGVYVGFKTYTFLFRDEKIVHTSSPLPEDEMK